jgi:hypothetical protein
METIGDSQIFMNNTHFMPSIYIKLMNRTQKNVRELVDAGIIVKNALDSYNPDSVQFDLKTLS